MKKLSYVITVDENDVRIEKRPIATILVIFGNSLQPVKLGTNIKLKIKCLEFALHLFYLLLVRQDTTKDA